MKKINGKRGISLIVLIITIIVIIILAAAIILSISKNNPITSANKAVKENDLKTTQEALVAWLGNRWISDNDGDGIAGDEVGAIYNGTISKTYPYLTMSLNGVSKNVKVSLDELGLDVLDSVTVVNNDVISIMKNENEYSNFEEYSVAQIKEKAASMYGKNVAYTAKNGYSDWKLFYADDENDILYLIASDTVENSLLDNSRISIVNNTKYCVYGNGLNVELDEFMDELQNAVSVKPAASIDLFCNSWNDVHKENKLTCQKDTPYSGMNNIVSANGKLDTSDKLYFPHTQTYDDCQGYWTLSRCVSGTIYIGYNGNYNGGYETSRPYFGVRPIVKLKTGIKLIDSGSNTLSIK